MIEILPETEEDTLAIVVSGKLTKDDYDMIEPELRLRADQFDTFDMVVELTDMEGMEPAAMLEDLKFVKEFGDDIGRMAVITGDALWQRCVDLTGRPFGKVMGVDLERFDDRVEAWKWLRGG